MNEKKYIKLTEQKNALFVIIRDYLHDNKNIDARAVYNTRQRTIIFYNKNDVFKLLSYLYKYYRKYYYLLAITTNENGKYKYNFNSMYIYIEQNYFYDIYRDEYHLYF